MEESKELDGERTMNRDLSFIYGRDPSILAYGQQPFPRETAKKGLESLYGDDEELESRCYTSSVASISSLGDTIKVYLRMRPFPRKMKLTKNQQEAYQIINEHTLLTKLPSMDNNCSSLQKLKPSDNVCRKFTFTHTFGPETTQLQLFEQAVKQHLNHFLNGQSATVMSYGTTNAGKSYTLQGTTASPGIIPRGLEFVFSNINPRATPCYKPLHNTDVVSLDANGRAYEMELKTKLLSFGSIDKSQYVQAYRTMQQLLQDESPLKPSEASDASYSVWVSFAEIYNETIYDLLSNDCQKKRPPLKLATDNSGKAFIRDLKMVCVNSGSEAYQLLMAGQHNLKVAATALNARSSRSHCIFTIKLLKYYTENSPQNVEVSTFSFCDLAGSERLKKTLNAGDRLKEAQNINTSLLVLGRCLKSIFDVQSSRLKHEVIGPFRESKLTRLFQSALSGKEHIALVVNVNPVPNLYIETQNVLNFSAIAKQIVIDPVARKKTASNSRFSQIVSRSVTTVTDWDVTDLESIGEEEVQESTGREEYIHIEDYDEVVQENIKLKKEVAALKNSVLNTDFEIRQEMSNMYTAMIKNLETNFKNRLQDVEEQQADMLEWSVKQVEDYYKEKLSTLSQRKRSRMDAGEDSEDEVNVEELEAENIHLMARVESLKKSVKEARESKEQLIIENNKKSFELSLAKKDLENCKNLLQAAQNDIGCGEEPKKVIEELEKQLSAREEQIKSLKTYLNEAKEEWLTITESLKKKDEQLLESSVKITDLTEQLEQANDCLAESSKTIETLEDRLDIYAKTLATTEENLQNAEDKWSKSNANYLKILKEKDELQIAVEKCSCEEKRVEELCKELDDAKEKLTSVKSSCDEIEQKFEAYKDSLESVETKLRVSENELVKSMEELEAVKSEKKILEDKILESDKMMEKLQSDLEKSRNENNKNTEDLEEKSNKIASLESQLSEAAEKLKEMSEKHSTEHENHVIKLEQEISAAKERDSIKEQLLEAHIQRISKLEKDLAEAAEFKEKQSTMEKELKICEEEKATLQKQLDENLHKILCLENEIQASTMREQEKENETISLQKEIKSMIQMTTSESDRDLEMEKEMKKALRELTSTQKELADTKAALKSHEKMSEEKMLRLEMRLKTHEENASYLAMLQEGAEKRQAETEQLRILNDELRREIEQKTQELVSFNKNRDDTIQRYETLVKQLQEDVDRSKREVSRYQELFLRQSTPTPNKDEIRKLKDELRSKTSLLEQMQAKLKKSESLREDNENINTSDDESLDSRRTRRRGRNNIPVSEDIPIIDLSGSESKRITRQTALLPPSMVPSVEKRKLRKKKLFVATEEGCVDIEPTEATHLPNTRSPLSVTQSKTRSRNKKK